MFSIYDNLTGTWLSIASYRTVEEANRDYHMNEGHTHVGDIGMKRAKRSPGQGDTQPRLQRKAIQTSCSL